MTGIDPLDTSPDGDSVAHPSTHEQGGDPACWLARVCPTCGRINEALEEEGCPYCESDAPPQDAGPVGR